MNKILDSTFQILNSVFPSLLSGTLPRGIVKLIPPGPIRSLQLSTIYCLPLLAVSSTFFIFNSQLSIIYFSLSSPSPHPQRLIIFGLVFNTIIYVLHFHFLIEHLFPPLIFPTFQFLFSTSLFFYPHSSSFLSHPSPLFYNSPLHTPETSYNIWPCFQHNYPLFTNAISRTISPKGEQFPCF
jgi:hypothetical protein